MLNLNAGQIIDVTAPSGIAVKVCGDCNNYAHAHPLNDQWVQCTNESFDRPGYDYYVHGRNGADVLITLVEDYSGNPANIVDLLDGVTVNFPDFDESPDFFNDGMDSAIYRAEDSLIDYDNGEREALAIERWSDNDPKTCTHAINCWRNNRSNVSTYGDFAGYSEHHVPNGFTETYDESAVVRNVFVESMEGFTAKQFLDLPKTEKYHWHLLNHFVDNKGRFAVGGVRLQVTNDVVVAECVNSQCKLRDLNGNYCQATMSLSLDAGRSEQEAFILEVIRHGNNHAAAWFTTRDTFYTINAFGPKQDENVTELSDVEFIMEHQAYCTSSACGCSEWLANEVPALRSA